MAEYRFVFLNEDNEINFLIYYKTDKYNIKKALPISYIEDSDYNLLVAIFDESGRDFIGQSSETEINELKKDYNMISLDNDYDTIINIIQNLTYDKYIHYKEYKFLK